MKTIITLILCGCFCISAWTQEQFRVMSSSTEFLQQLSVESSTLETIQSDFTQTKYMEMLSEKIVSKGKFYYKKEGKIRMDYSSPIKYLLIINDKKIKIVSDGKTSIFDTKNNKMMEQMNTLISACMTGNLGKLSSAYTFEYKENATHYWIQVQPKGSVKSYMKHIDIYLDKKDLSVQRLRLTEASSDYTEYLFSNKQQNVKIDDAEFRIS